MPLESAYNGSTSVACKKFIYIYIYYRKLR